MKKDQSMCQTVGIKMFLLLIFQLLIILVLSEDSIHNHYSNDQSAKKMQVQCPNRLEEDTIEFDISPMDNMDNGNTQDYFFILQQNKNLHNRS